MAESVDVSEDAVVMEVEDGTIKGDVHDCLFPEGITPDRFFVCADIGAGEEVDYVTWLTMSHGPIEGWFPRTWGNSCTYCKYCTGVCRSKIMHTWTFLLMCLVEYQGYSGCSESLIGGGGT